MIAAKYCRECGAKRGQEHEDICPSNVVAPKARCTEKQKRLMWSLGFVDVDRYRLSPKQAGTVIGMLKSGATPSDIESWLS